MRRRQTADTGRTFWHTHRRPVVVGEHVTIDDDRGLRGGVVVFRDGDDVVVRLDSARGAELLHLGEYDDTIEEDTNGGPGGMP